MLLLSWCDYIWLMIAGLEYDFIIVWNTVIAGWRFYCPLRAFLFIFLCHLVVAFKAHFAFWRHSAENCQGLLSHSLCLVDSAWPWNLLKYSSLVPGQHTKTPVHQINNALSSSPHRNRDVLTKHVAQYIISQYHIWKRFFASALKLEFKGQKET